MIAEVTCEVILFTTCFSGLASFVSFIIGWLYSDHREKNRVLRKFEVFRRIQDAKINELKTKIAEQEVELVQLQRELGEKE
jgi:hypothetical protein